MADVTQVAELLYGDKNAVYAGAGYAGVEKRKEYESREVIWQAQHRFAAAYTQLAL